MLITIRNIVTTLLILSILGYIFVVLRQKLLLKNNMVLINKSSVTKKLLDKADLKEFTVSGFKVKSGDEIVVTTKAKEKLKGILIGIAKEEKSLLLVTYNDRVEECSLEDINKFKVISKYGYFF